MAFHVHLIDPRTRTDQGPILDGVTHRPASWPSRAAAQATVDHWTSARSWNRNLLRESWSYDYQIIDTKDIPCSQPTEPSPGTG